MSSVCGRLLADNHFPLPCVLAQGFCISRRWDRGGGWGHMQSAVHMAAAKLGCKRTMIGTGWAHSHPGCVNRLRERYSHLVGVHFWQGRLLGFRMGICQMRIQKRLGLINQKFNCHGVA